MDVNNSGKNPQSPNDTSSKYQDILDQYSKQITTVPDSEAEPEVQTITDSDNVLKIVNSGSDIILPPPSPVSLPTAIIPPRDNTVSVLPPNPVVVQPSAIPAPATINTTVHPGNIEPPATNIAAKGSNFFKVLFYVSLLIFLAVASALAFSFVGGSKNGSNSVNPVPTIVEPTSVPEVESFCYLNDNKYKLNESFPSADGCNTCSCGLDGTISCTEKACNE